MENEYIKKSDIINRLNQAIEKVKCYTENQNPMFFGIRLGFEGVKNFLENSNDEGGEIYEQTAKTIKEQKIP